MYIEKCSEFSPLHCVWYKETAYGSPKGKTGAKTHYEATGQKKEETEQQKEEQEPVVAKTAQENQIHKS